MKKLLSIVLAILILTGLFGFAASATRPFVHRPSSHGLIWPMPGFGQVSRGFWMYGGRMSSGVNISGPNMNGAGVVAVRDGVVESVTSFCRMGFGYQVVIDHGGGMHTRYVHLMTGSVAVEPGQQVEMGQPIARVGIMRHAHAPQLHFQVLINGRPQNPLNFVHQSNGAQGPAIR